MRHENRPGNTLDISVPWRTDGRTDERRITGRTTLLDLVDGSNVGQVSEESIGKC